MSNNITVGFSVDQSPEEVFAAIKNVRGWWSAKIEGDADAFVFRNGDLHYSKQKLVEQVAAEKIYWLVEESELTFIADRKEWKGTRFGFELARRDGKTEVRFTHFGLTPEQQCYAACQRGWSYYAGDSLRKLITTGTGTPDLPRLEPVKVVGPAETQQR